VSAPLVVTRTPAASASIAVIASPKRTSAPRALARRASMSSNTARSTCHACDGVPAIASAKLKNAKSPVRSSQNSAPCLKW
jgi:hypothetical protein